LQLVIGGVSQASAPELDAQSRGQRPRASSSWLAIAIAQSLMRPPERSRDFGEIVGVWVGVFLLSATTAAGSDPRTAPLVVELDVELENLGQKEAPIPTAPIRQHGGEARHDGGGAGSHPQCSVPCPKGGRDGGTDELAKLLPRQTAQSTSPQAQTGPMLSVGAGHARRNWLQDWSGVVLPVCESSLHCPPREVPSELASEES